MKSEAEKRLIELPRANAEVPYADECIRGIHNVNLFEKGQEGPLPMVEHVRLLFSRRAKHVSKYKYPIHGIDRLVENLEKTDRSHVRMHLIETEQFTYHIFTVREALFGIVAMNEPID